MSAASSARVRELNDAFRPAGASWSLTGCRIAGRRAGAPLARVQAFADFTGDNDPHGEHDFGAIEHGGTRYLFLRR
jgi:hypothetical protein